MPPQTRKPGHVRRREIAQAALTLLGEQGASSLTTANLARVVGVTSGALFRHFSTLDAVLEAAVELAIERVEGTFPPADLGPLERLRTLAERRVALFGAEPGVAWLLFSDQAEQVVPAAATARLRDLVQRSRAFLATAFAEGVESGEVRGDLEAGTLLPIFTGTVHSLVSSRGVHRGTRARQARATAVLDTLFHLLTPPSSHEHHG